MASNVSEPSCDPVLSGRIQPLRPHPVYWVIAAALAVIALKLIVWPEQSPGVSAMAQPVMSGGSRGVFAFSGQLTKNTFGVYMVDGDAMTLWAYEILPQNGCLRLAAARTWRYDRYLEDHNGCDLPPGVIEKMIEQQRMIRRQSTESEMP